MDEWIFTFGSGQTLAGYYVRIKAPSYEEARQKMIDNFDTEWCYQYSKKDWEDWIKKAQKLMIPIEEELFVI